MVLTARAVFYFVLSIFLPLLGFCVALDFPHQFWVEFYPLRWIVFAAMLGYVWWLWPQVLRIMAERRKDRETSR